MTFSELSKVWQEFAALLPTIQLAENTRNRKLFVETYRRRDTLWREYLKIRESLFKQKRDNSH